MRYDINSIVNERKRTKRGKKSRVCKYSLTHCEENISNRETSLVTFVAHKSC